MSTEMTKKNEETGIESASAERWIKPAVDIYENPDEWLITADLPGVHEEALKISLEKRELTLEGRRVDDGFTRPDVGFKRSFALPQEIDSDKVSAELKHGVVSIHLPKSEAIKPREIRVQVG